MPRTIRIMPFIVSQVRSLKYWYIYLEKESGIRKIIVERIDMLKIYKNFSLIFFTP